MSTGGRMLVNLPPEKRVVFLGCMVGDQRETDLFHVADTYTSHFATCPKADEHRRRKER
jgi:hypothetical protein